MYAVVMYAITGTVTALAKLGNSIFQLGYVDRIRQCCTSSYACNLTSYKLSIV